MRDFSFAKMPDFSFGKTSSTNPAGIYLLKVNTRTKCETCSKLTIKTPE